VLAQHLRHPRLLEGGVALVLGPRAGVDDLGDPRRVEVRVQLGPAGALDAVRRPRPALLAERQVVRRMPVAGGDDEVEARVARQLVDAVDDRVAAGHGQRAVGRDEVVLVVDDDESLRHCCVLLVTRDRAVPDGSHPARDCRIAIAIRSRSDNGGHAVPV